MQVWALGATVIDVAVQQAWAGRTQMNARWIQVSTADTSITRDSIAVMTVCEACGICCLKCAQVSSGKGPLHLIGRRGPMASLLLTAATL